MSASARKSNCPTCRQSPGWVHCLEWVSIESGEQLFLLIFHKRSTGYPIYVAQSGNMLFHRLCYRSSPFWLILARKRVTKCCSSTSPVTAVQAAVIRRHTLSRSLISSEYITLFRWPHKSNFKGHRSGDLCRYSVVLFHLTTYIGIVDPTIHARHSATLLRQENGAVSTKML